MKIREDSNRRGHIAFALNDRFMVVSSPLSSSVYVSIYSFVLFIG